MDFPFVDNTEKNLYRYFQIDDIPSLIILGLYGKIVQTCGVDLIREYGIIAYPFTKEWLDEVRAKFDAEDEAKRKAQTLESLLVSDERNFVIRHGGA